MAELSEAIDRLGGESVMAFVAETIGGATAGTYEAIWLEGTGPRSPTNSDQP